MNPETGKWIIRGLNSLETFLFGSSDVMSITGLTPHTLTLTDKGADRKRGYWIGLAKINPDLLLASTDFPSEIRKDTAKLNELRHRGHYDEVINAFMSKTNTPLIRYMVHTETNRLNAQLHPELAPAAIELNKKAFAKLCHSWQSGKGRLPTLDIPEEAVDMYMKYGMRTAIESSLHIPTLKGQANPRWYSLDIERPS